ncbi:MAG: methylcrotonoyl-CoA carboxylase [Bdellovibrionales bacterium]|nr:methylcrotonoyl-CoA carboxylase [Bdellovibrionales bacterium]
MEAYRSRLNSQSRAYQENYQKMLELVNGLQDTLRQALSEGESVYTEKHSQQGKLLARERVAQLLDPESPFLELMPLAGLGQKGVNPGASVVGGIGLVSGRECLIVANVPTIKGGAINAFTLLKMQRLAVIARENRLPTVFLVESAGADLPNQAEIYNYGGAQFREITRRSKLGIPSVSVVFGSSTAGGAYIPGMSDYVIMVDQQAKVYLAGPPLVKMAINEDVDDETLGGAKMHATQSGVADYLAQNEEDGLAMAREIVGLFKVHQPTGIDLNVQEPLYDADEILGLVSADVRLPFEMRELIARIVDGSRFSEFKPLYGESLVTAFAQVYGMQVGILANNGVLESAAAEKGAQFIQLCDQQNIPLLFLQNITGFMVGTEAEHGGIIKNGAKLINAVANARVPGITILVGASYGAGNYGMCGLAYEPRFLFSYPNSRLAVMGPEQLAGVMELLQKDKLAKMPPQKAEQLKAQTEALRQKVEMESTAQFATGRVWDDGIIDPRQTRPILGICLNLLYSQEADTQSKKELAYGVFRM